MKQRRQFPGATPYMDRHGKRRWRFRKGSFSAQLGTNYGSDEFVERYEAALDGHRTRGLSGVGSVSAPNTLNALIASYYRSPGVLALAESTKRSYRGIIEPLRTAHGLRKACARRLAEAGATANEIASVTGHKTLSEVQRYTDQADRVDMANAAIEKLVKNADANKTLVNLPIRFAKQSTNDMKGKKK